MQYTTIALASGIFLFGLYTLIMTFKSPNQLIKLKYMKAKLGAKVGNTLHSFAYVIVPFVFGYFMFKAGLEGQTITQFITGK
jgi:hypothetical protein